MDDNHHKCQNLVKPLLNVAIFLFTLFVVIVQNFITTVPMIFFLLLLSFVVFAFNYYIQDNILYRNFTLTVALLVCGFLIFLMFDKLKTNPFEMVVSDFNVKTKIPYVLILIVFIMLYYLSRLMLFYKVIIICIDLFLIWVFYALSSSLIINYHISKNGDYYLFISYLSLLCFVAMIVLMPIGFTQKDDAVYGYFKKLENLIKLHFLIKKVSKVSVSMMQKSEDFIDNDDENKLKTKLKIIALSFEITKSVSSIKMLFNAKNQNPATLEEKLSEILRLLKLLSSLLSRLDSQDENSKLNTKLRQKISNLKDNKLLNINNETKKILDDFICNATVSTILEKLDTIIIIFEDAYTTPKDKIGNAIAIVSEFRNVKNSGKIATEIENSDKVDDTVDDAKT